jgi:putative transposase
MAMPQGPNQRWSLDFVHDATADGQRFRILAVVDDFTRECLCLAADTSLPGVRVARELDAIVAVRGRPAGIVSDNGPELTGLAMLRWSHEARVAWHYIDPGKPRQNAFVESFNGRLRDDPRIKSGGKPCSARSRTPARRWRPGRTTTTPCGHTAASAICRPPPTPGSALPRRNGMGRLRDLGALIPSAAQQRRGTRPIPLRNRAVQAQMTNGLYPRLDERRGSGHYEQDRWNPTTLRTKQVIAKFLAQ